MVDQTTFVEDILFFVKDTLASAVTDPIGSTRSSKSKFIMTSYPTRPAEYPLITIKATNYSGSRVGMQSNAMDLNITLEIRVWGRNTKERDSIFTQVFNTLRQIQFTSLTGSIDNNLHDFNIPSVLEVNEDGEQGIKSKIIEVSYKFYNFS